MARSEASRNTSAGCERVAMRFHRGSLLTAFFVLLFGYALFEARNFTPQSRIYPILAAGIGFIFTLLALWWELLGKGGVAEQGGMMDIMPDTSTSPDVVRRRALNVLAWLLALYFGIWILGFKIAIFLFFILFLKLEGRAGWLLTIILTAVSIYLIVFQFEIVLGVFWPEGLLGQLLGESLPWLF